MLLEFFQDPETMQPSKNSPEASIRSCLDWILGDNCIEMYHYPGRLRPDIEERHKNFFIPILRLTLLHFVDEVSSTLRSCKTFLHPSFMILSKNSRMSRIMDDHLIYVIGHRKHLLQS